MFGQGAAYQDILIEFHQYSFALQCYDNVIRTLKLGLKRNKTKLIVATVLVITDDVFTTPAHSRYSCLELGCLTRL